MNNGTLPIKLREQLFIATMITLAPTVSLAMCKAHYTDEGYNNKEGEFKVSLD